MTLTATRPAIEVGTYMSLMAEPYRMFSLDGRHFFRIYANDDASDLRALWVRKITVTLDPETGGTSGSVSTPRSRIANIEVAAA